jgi:arylsulfatase A-like enzyme
MKPKFILAGFLAAVLVSTAAAALDEDKLSVLLITVDNLRPDRMSVYGHFRDTTPYLKQFARESLVFDNAFSTSAWTAPGMVSIFTGYYPPVHAQHGRFSYYDDDMASALKVLADSGYEILGQAIRGPSHQGFGFQKILGKKPDRLQDFIEARVDDPTPFFAWAHLKDVHLPYDPSPASAALFDADRRSNAALEAVRKHRVILRHPERVDVEFDHAGKVEFDNEDIPVVRALYDGEVVDVDARLERYLERMRETGLLERSIVILSADHGEELFDHGWLGHASTGYDAKLYDELIRIPLIIRLPNAALQGRFDAMVQGVDYMPTIFDLLGVDATRVEPAMQGRSLLPLVEGKVGSIREHVFTQTSLKGWTTPRDEMTSRIVSVRSEKRKLIRIPDVNGIRVEAYDLENDPGERNNIYQRRAQEFQSLERALDDWVNDNRAAAASLVMDGAGQRIEKIARLLLQDADLDAAVSSWKAIQTMEQTWGLEPDVFYRFEPYSTSWRKLQQTAARMIGLAMTCRADGGLLQTAKPAQPLALDEWSCR